MLVALVCLWYSNGTALLAAMLVSNALLMTYYGGAEPVLWMGYPIFAAQIPPIFMCVAIVLSMHRLGQLAVHKAWRHAIIALVFHFLFVSRFSSFPTLENSIAERYDTIYGNQQRLWIAMFFSVIFVGGIGQVLWIVFDGWKRWLITLAAFPASSVLFCLTAFYGATDLPKDLFWQAVWNSQIVVVLASLFLGLPAAIACHLHPSTAAQINVRLRTIARELTNRQP
jgi:hypothetical protein